MKKHYVKLCILGSMNTGKTTLICSIRDQNIHCIDSTIGVAFHHIKRYINNEIYNINIWDTAGQERYEALIPMYYRTCHIALLVFDVTDISTYYKMIEYYNKVDKKSHKIIIGNKLDLIADKKILQQFDNIRYNIIYTSALKKINFHMIFNRIDESLDKIDFSNEQTPVRITANYTNDYYDWNCCT